jgi:tetratricopeptide (TPR) repeat protein
MCPCSKYFACLLVLCSCFSLGFSQPSKRADKYLKKGNAKLQKKQLEEAIERYTKAIALDPTFADAYVRRGMARLAKGDLDGSIATPFSTAVVRGCSSNCTCAS